MSRASAQRVVVVGSGIAGLTAALEARAAGARVTVLTKAAPDASNTRFAQGGIAAVTTPDDSVASHIEDTLIAGGGHADPDAVRAMAAEGPAAIDALEARGVAFDRDAGGEPLLGREGAHSVARILHAGGDATGVEIQRALLTECAARGVTLREGAFVTDVVVAGGRIAGVRVLGAEEPVAADAVILATGGLGQVYGTTTNPDVATGDGVALALCAGARVRDMEFVQFHPTVLAVGEPFLVSEAVRGEGAVLRDEQGRRFAFDAHPDGELAPRDVVARAIARTMAAQGGRPVMLDATALGADFLARRFPTIDRAMRERGLDWGREQISVSPAAHYAMGGVATDLHGRTGVPGLLAAGEAARTGVHGANRLASNSLLEGAVFGARAGRAAANIPVNAYIASRGSASSEERATHDGASGAGPHPAASSPEEAARGATAPASDTSGAGELGIAPSAGDPTTVPTFSRDALQALMRRHAGLERDGAGLAAAAATITAWRTIASAPGTMREHEDRNLLDVAAEVVAAAAARTASLGAHWRSDAADRTRSASSGSDTAQTRSNAAHPSPSPAPAARHRMLAPAYTIADRPDTALETAC